MIFAFITGVSLLIQFQWSFDIMVWMQHFMDGFFLVFSFFKSLNIKGFAESYGMYDIVAKRFTGWDYVYVLVELALGITYLIGLNR